jgi:hypothetical protein
MPGAHVNPSLGNDKATFSGSTVVALGGAAKPVIIGIEQDNSLPDSASLTWGTSDAPTDLAGTVGDDCKLIHGNRCQEIRGNLTENVRMDVLASISGAETRTISGNRTTVVHGDDDETIYGSSNYTYVGPQGQTRTSTLTMDYAGAVQTNYNAEDWHWQPHSYQAIGFQFQFAAINIQLFGVVMQLVMGIPPNLLLPPLPPLPPLNINLIAGLNLSLDVLNLQTTAALQIDCEPFKMTLEAIEAKLFGAEAKVGATAQGGPHVGVPASLGAN